MKKLIGTLSVIGLLLIPQAAFAAQDLVEVTLEEGYVVSVPVGVAASVCDENAGVIAKQGSCVANPDKLPIKVPTPFV